MVLFELPQTLVRLGRFDGPLEEAAGKFREPLAPILLSLGNTVQYAFFKACENPYFLMVSQSIDKMTIPPGYNTILTVTSHSDERNREVAGRFESETGLCPNLNVPGLLQSQLNDTGECFKVFEKEPYAAMRFLRKGSLDR